MPWENLFIIRQKMTAFTVINVIVTNNTSRQQVSDKATQLYRIIANTHSSNNIETLHLKNCPDSTVNKGICTKTNTLER